MGTSRCGKPSRATALSPILLALAGCGGDGDTPLDPNTPAPDLVVDSLAVSPAGPTDSDTVEISFQVANLGNAATPGGIPYLVTIDGASLSSDRAGALGADGRLRVALSVPPLEAGARRISVVVDPDDRIRERNERNNEAGIAVAVASLRPLGLGQPVTVSSSTTDEVILFRVDVEEAAQEALNVELSGGSGDADMFVHFGERPPHHYDYECTSGNAASDELCQMVPARAGSYHVAIHAFTSFGPSTLTATVGGKPVETFDIEVVFLDNGTPSQDEIVREAARRWESVIARGARDHDFGPNNHPANDCFPGQPAVSDEVDDLRVWVIIDSIDGVGEAVARSGPCSVRVSRFPASDDIYKEAILGAIQLDEIDVGRMEANGVLLPVVVHEMAHVLGFGTTWDEHDLIADPSLPANPIADTRFTGRLARAAFDAAGGTGYTGGAKVPVQSGARSGSSDAHWRESVFVDELMTPFVGGGHALSLITIESLADMGYGVDLTRAESYTLPGSRPAGMRTGSGPVVYLGDDILRRPIVLVDQKGRTSVRYPRR